MSYNFFFIVEKHFSFVIYFETLSAVPTGIWAYRTKRNHWNAESPKFCCTSCYSGSFEWPWSCPQRYVFVTVQISTNLFPREEQSCWFSVILRTVFVARMREFWSQCLSYLWCFHSWKTHMHHLCATQFLEPWLLKFVWSGISCWVLKVNPFSTPVGIKHVQDFT